MPDRKTLIFGQALFSLTREYINLCLKNKITEAERMMRYFKKRVNFGQTKQLRNMTYKIAEKIRQAKNKLK